MTAVTPVTTPARRVRIGLLGMYASANLGDTAIQQAVMGALSNRRSDLEFVAICTAPHDAALTFGLRAHDVSGFGPAVLPGAPVVGGGAPSLWERAPRPLRLAMASWRIDRLVRSIDMLLVSGSGQIDDFWGGPWEQPFRLRAWATAARRQRKPVAFFGVGVDQLLTADGTRLATEALGLAQLRVLRDEGSRDALRRLGFAADCDVCPDPAFHLARGGRPADQERPFAVMSPIARQAWPGSLDASYDTYIDALACAADHLQARGLEVRFVCSQTRMDPPVVPRVLERMRGQADATVTCTPRGVGDYMDAVAGAEVVVASRLHALILAMAAGTPVVGISYARKVSRQMADAGLAAYALDLQEATAPAVLQRLDAALARGAGLRDEVSATAGSFRAAVDRRFDRLAALLPPPLPA